VTVRPVLHVDVEFMERDDPAFHARYLEPAMAVLSNITGRSITERDVWFEEYGDGSIDIGVVS